MGIFDITTILMVVTARFNSPIIGRWDCFRPGALPDSLLPCNPSHVAVMYGMTDTTGGFP